MESRFRVTFQGKLKTGYTVEQAQQNIAALYKVPISKLDGWFSGKCITVKKGIDYTTAQKYQQALEKCGIICNIEPLATPSSAPLQSASKEKTPPPQQSIICPKCGFEQPYTQECGHCGVIIHKYLERKKQEFLEKKKRQEKALQAQPENPITEEDSPPQEEQELGLLGKIAVAAVDHAIHTYLAELTPQNNGYAWKEASQEAKTALCKYLARGLQSDIMTWEHIYQFIDTKYDTADPTVLLDDIATITRNLGWVELGAQFIDRMQNPEKYEQERLREEKKREEKRLKKKAKRQVERFYFYHGLFVFCTLGLWSPIWLFHYRRWKPINEKKFPHSLHFVSSLVSIILLGWWIPVWIIHYVMYRKSQKKKDSTQK